MLDATTRIASLIDGCPECVTNTEAPKTWAREGDSVTCAYHCTDCGHAWLTNWKD